MKKLIALLCLLVCTIILLSGCTTTRSITVNSDQPPLRIGVTPNYPPLMFKQKGTIVGIEADLARQLAEFLDRSVVFVEEPWDQQIPALLEGKTDIIMSGMSITELRKVRVAFAVPFLRVGQQMLVRNEDARKYSALTLPVTRARIGVEKGTTGDQFVQEQCRVAEAVPFKDPGDAAKALIKGKVDLVLHDAPVVWWLASEYEADGLTGIFTPLTDESLAWAVRPTERDLLAEVNTFLSVIQEDGSLDETILRWAPFAR